MQGLLAWDPRHSKTRTVPFMLSKNTNRKRNDWFALYRFCRALTSTCVKCTTCCVDSKGQHPEHTGTKHKMVSGPSAACSHTNLELNLLACRDLHFSAPGVTLSPPHLWRCIHIPVPKAGVTANNLVKLPIVELHRRFQLGLPTQPKNVALLAGKILMVAALPCFFDVVTLMGIHTQQDGARQDVVCLLLACCHKCCRWSHPRLMVNLTGASALALHCSIARHVRTLNKSSRCRACKEGPP